MLYDLDDSINSTVAKFIEENCKEGDREQTGLDPRAFGKFWYCLNSVLTPSSSDSNEVESLVMDLPVLYLPPLCL